MTYEFWRRFGRFFIINNAVGHVAFNYRDRRMAIIRIGSGSGQII